MTPVIKLLRGGDRVVYPSDPFQVYIKAKLLGSSITSTQTSEY